MIDPDAGRHQSSGLFVFSILLSAVYLCAKNNRIELKPTMMIDKIKDIVWALILAVVAYLKPLQGEMSALFLLFFVNFLVGYFAGMIANNEEFNFKKAGRCILEALVFFALCTCIYAEGKLKGNEHGAMQCVSFVTYVIIYFYGVNIVKNLMKIFREGTIPYQIFAFLYYILRFKFVEQIPYLKEYLNKSNQKLQENEKGIQ